MRTRTISALVLAIGVGLLAAPNSGVAARHLSLVRAEPAKDTTITAAPKVLKLYFSEAVRPGVAGVRLMTSDSTTVALGPLASGDKGTAAHAPVVAPVTGAMKPGSYRVVWRVTGADGHTLNGDFGFTLKAAADESR